MKSTEFKNKSKEKKTRIIKCRIGKYDDPITRTQKNKALVRVSNGCLLFMR